MSVFVGHLSLLLFLLLFLMIEHGVDFCVFALELCVENGCVIDTV